VQELPKKQLMVPIVAMQALALGDFFERQMRYVLQLIPIQAMQGEAKKESLVQVICSPLKRNLQSGQLHQS
jgi:hypothetical protein